jgi:uncharacterized protein (TIGR02246 family)
VKPSGRSGRVYAGSAETDIHEQTVIEPRPDDVEALYFSLLQRWNDQDAAGMAALFVADGHVVGFDGSELDGRQEIDAGMRDIFSHHRTPTYVGKIRSVRLIDSVAVVRAVAGMVPPGQRDLNPALNAVQTLIASHNTGRWLVELFHNTPAAFHGRPEAGERLTAELREVLRRLG